MKKIILIVFFVGVILSACGGAPVSTAPSPLGTPTSQLDTPCSVPAHWAIQFNRSGGFAGVSESLTLDSGGNLRVQSERPAVNVRKTISGDQVNAIGELLVWACPFEMKPNDAGCADCFLYKLVVQMDGKTYVMLATDVTLTEDLHPLISTLNQILQDAGE